MPIKPARERRREAEAEQREVVVSVRQFATRAVQEWGAAAVYLFGSRARDDWRRGSDADLIVLSDRFAGMTQLERAVALGRLWSGPVGCEPMGFTPDEWEAGRDRAGIISMALEGGVLQVWPEERFFREGLRQRRAASPGGS